MKTELFIQVEDRQTDYKILVDTAKEIWKEEGRKVKDIVSMELYFKPIENSCYYVINGDEKGQFFV